MRIVRFIAIIGSLMLLLATGTVRSVSAEPAGALKATFVRGGDLWIKIGDLEKQLTRGQKVVHPKWSFDGNWIAYTSGQEQQELWVLQVATGKARKLSANGGAWSSYQWAPNRNRLGFLSEQKLLWADPLQPSQIVKVASDIGNFSWLPDGGGVMVSTAARVAGNEGWTPISIVKLPLTAAGVPLQPQTIYTLPKPSDQFLAVGTSIFKWSADQRWIAFLATPTASLSADSNALCLLSSDGSTFKIVDQMVHNDQWFAWSSAGSKLAYIGGTGREASMNKQLKVMDAPDGKPILYTPTGSVDQGLAWQSASELAVMRVQEWNPSSGESSQAKRPFPSLVKINLDQSKMTPITSPSPNYGDYNPTVLSGERLAWVRSDRQAAQVLVARADGKFPRMWIQGLDVGVSYYEQWDWSSVLQFAK